MAVIPKRGMTATFSHPVSRPSLFPDFMKAIYRSDRNITRLYLTGCIALMMILAACEFIPDPQKKKVSIVRGASDLGDAAFFPNPVIVQLGGHVVWRNNDKLPHSIVGDAKHGICAFRSDGIRARKTFSLTFSQRVTCTYYCGIHGRAMRGRIIVQ